MASPQSGERLKVAIALASLYILWSSTYLAIRIAIESIPPFMMAGLRFFISGWAVYAFLRFTGEKAPEIREWAAGFLVGFLLLLVGNGGVVYAEQWVASSIAALGVATVPLWTILFFGLWGKWPGRLEWIGVALGFAGVALLNLEGDLRANPAGAIAIIVATMGWSLGSAWGRRLPLPKGLMAAAVQMIAGGLFFFILSFLWGEPVPTGVTLRSGVALSYLIVFGAIIGFCAYTYLINNVRASLATSYAYVNPVFAVLIGVVGAGETITAAGIGAMVVITAAVMLVVAGNRGAKESD